MTLYNNYLIVAMNEGEHLIPERNQILIAIANNYYEDRPFVYITYCIYSYSIDPDNIFKNIKDD